MPGDGSIAVVIVAFNVRNDLLRCLDSLATQRLDVPMHITVVDNQSTDRTAAAVRERFPEVQVIESANVGFARGNNLGIRASTSAIVLLLNPDTIVPPDAVASLRSSLLADSSIGIVAPRLVDDGGRAELSFGWPMSPLGELAQKITGHLYAARAPLVAAAVDRWTRRAGDRAWVSGACLMLRRHDLEAVGLLDERYFLYTEDIDLCMAIRARGQRIRFCPDIEVQHLRGRSGASNARTELYRRASHLAFYAKHHPAWAPLLRLYLRVTGRPVPPSP